MYLLVDLSAKDRIVLMLFDERTIRRHESLNRNRYLLQAIDSFFQQENFDKRNLEGMMVVVGEGGFTSTRIGAVVANTFGYVLGIPLLAITKEETSDPPKLISRLASQPVEQYISASYSAEPNIGGV